MKATFILLFSMIFVQSVFSQGYNSENIAFGNFLERLYLDSPFEGVRIVQDYNNTYLISVLALNTQNYESQSTLNRVASVKAMAQASRYFNGSDIDDDIVIYTSEDVNGKTEVKTIEKIKEHSKGYVRALELIKSFKTGDEYQVFIFSTKINDQD